MHRIRRQRERPEQQGSERDVVERTFVDTISADGEDARRDCRDDGPHVDSLGLHWRPGKQLRRCRPLKRVRGEPVRSVERPSLPGVADRIEALAHPSQRLVEDLHLLTASFIGRLGGAARTFGRHPGRTLPPQ